MYILIIKSLAVLMSVMTLFNGLSFSAPAVFVELYKAEMTYEFANDEPGSAAGSVVVTAAKDGEYDLVWGDSDGKTLVETSGGKTAKYTEFVTVNVQNGSGEAEVYTFTAIPEKAETVLIEKNGFTVGHSDIPEAKKADNGELLYSFGALSDVHFCRYMYPVADTSLIAFPTALSFLDAFGVDLVAMSGDLSNSGTEEAFKRYNGFVSQYDFPVYTCTGNHDVHTDFTLENWHKYVNNGVYGETKADGIVCVSENGLDFVYEHKGDVFIFLCQYQWSYNHDDSRILTDEQLDWLEAQLEKYSDNRVYLFFHTFLNAPEGELLMGEGNVLTSGGAHYDLAFTNGAPDEVRFRALMKENKNVIYFNGHSHIKYELQSINPELNITDHNGEYCTMVHISSVASPRYASNSDNDFSERFLRNSEGYLIDVYADKIVIKGVEFFGYKILGYATYVVNT